MVENEKPLTGIRVLDIACFIAAPYAATLMGEFGADVIKIEHPNGGMDVDIEISIRGGKINIKRSGFIRTARKIFDGEVFIKEKDS